MKINNETTIIKLKSVNIKNLKNVKNGLISSEIDFENIEEGNVVGLYGQNGSGKTAMVEALTILKKLIIKERLPFKEEYYVNQDSENIEIEYIFLLKNSLGEYYIKYEVTLGYNEAIMEDKDKIYLIPIKEVLSYRENISRHTYKILFSKEDEDIHIRKKHISKMSIKDNIDLTVRVKMTLKESYSFIFDSEVREKSEKFLSEVEFEILRSIEYHFVKDLHIISAKDSSYALGKIFLPITLSIANSRGKLAANIDEASVVAEKKYVLIKQIVGQINLVTEAVIPGLGIEVKLLNEETMDNGEVGMNIEFLTTKIEKPLPLRCESGGSLKLISIISALVAAYNNPNALIVIDELDSGVFEYLLGELLKVISDGGCGQLFFTSHNLRLLEVLNHKNMWFTTTNENERYIQLSGVKTMSNPRDMYLRAVQLGGQKEVIYNRTKSSKIRRALRKAGEFYES